ncbi:MAG: hypothetical protein AB8G15_12605 [Saprospiraceae bacterium]
MYLLESTVQKEALRYLEKHYRKRAKRSIVFSRIEVGTKQQYGGKRADGVIAFRHYFWGNYLVSIEAKSFKTLPAIQPVLDTKKLLWNSFLIGFFCCLGSGAIWFLLKMEDGYLQFITPLNVWVISAILYGFFTQNSYQHKTVAVIQQLKQYPGNEQWLAFSKDSLTKITARQKKQLLRICKYQGIGVVVVTKVGKVKIWRRASRSWNFFGDYFKYYSKEKEIRRTLS